MEGTCDPRFAPVQEAFAENFHSRGEIGAGVCVSVHGRRVVDLWSGWADPKLRSPWRADTLVNAFSIGKALVAVLAARVVGEGRLDLDRPVAAIWSDFGRHGKDRLTLRDALTHRAGVPALRPVQPPEVIYDWAAMTSALAAEEPWWEPGTAHGYHVNTFGFLVGEVLRRATGQTVGELLRTAVAAPLAADVMIGVPPADLGRCARFQWSGDVPTGPVPGLVGEQLMRFNAYFNPPGISGAGVVNDERWRRAEMPSTNCHASARGVARVFEALVAGGAVDGVRVVDRAALASAATEQASGVDLVLDRPSRFGLGLQLTQPDRPLGPNPGAFGHFGAGGSLGFCDPESGVAFGYVMNQLGPRWQNPRNRALIDAVFASLS